MGWDAWAVIGVFVAAQVLSLVVVVTTLKSDAKSLRGQVWEMKEELKKLTDVVVTQAMQGQQLKQVQEVQVMTGKRLDELSGRLNRYVDKVAFDAMDAKT